MGNIRLLSSGREQRIIQQISANNSEKLALFHSKCSIMKIEASGSSEKFVAI
jgi:hypothetical protein